MTKKAREGGVLAWIERTGNALPDPAFIFVWLIVILIGVSLVCAGLGVSVSHPIEVDRNGLPLLIEARSLLAPDNIRLLLVDMPRTFTRFPPLGYVLVVMLGAGLAERSGLFSTAMTAIVRKAPPALLTPVVAIAAMLSNQAADAAYVVLIPLAGAAYAAAGRHPVAGIATGFAGVSGGFSANLLPGQLDALLLGLTEQAGRTLDPGFQVNIAGNWFFMVAMTLVFTPVIWFVTDRLIEPRLGSWDGSAQGGDTAPADEARTRRGLQAAGLAALGVVALWVFLTIGPGTVLIDEAARPEARLAPLYRSLVAAFFVLFLAAAVAYGTVAGTVKSHRDVVEMMSGGMRDMAYYMVLAFFAAHFVAMFNWSNLGLILAVGGANALKAASLPAPVLLAALVLIAGLINLFIGSASAKWALLAPVFVPMLMLLGIGPEMATAAYRVGDSVTNIITPLMVYLPLVLVFARRWDRGFGLGSLTAAMLPYSLSMLAAGLALTVIWATLALPLGPGADMFYELGRSG